MNYLYPNTVYKKLSPIGKTFFQDILFEFYINNSLSKDCTRKFVIESFETYLETSESHETRIVSNYEVTKIISHFINDMYYNDYLELRDKFPEAFI